jgi:hypothetical protein
MFVSYYSHYSVGPLGKWFIHYQFGEANVEEYRLTLTEASRAYLMEPHWYVVLTRAFSVSLVHSKPRFTRNPTIEEQALARIHRIGQRREVTTVRFYIRDSFEERVMETQESKRNLAGVLLSGHDGGQADDSLGALQVGIFNANVADDQRC